MMKKGILIGVLAALMLFAFTACEQKTPNSPLYGAQVESVTVAEQPLYIAIPTGVGSVDTIDPSVIKFNVKYNDGKVYTYTGAQLGITANDVKDGATVDALTKTIVVKLDKAGKYTFYPQVKAYAATGATIDLSSIEGPVEIEDAKKVTVPVKATVASAGGSKEFDYSFEVKAADISTLIKDNELKTGSTFTVTAEYATTLGKAFIETAKAKGLELAFTGSVDVIVVDSTATKIDHISAKLNDNTIIFADVKGLASGAKKTIADTDITVTKYDKDGNVVTESDYTKVTIHDNRGVMYDAGYTWKEADTYTVIVKLSTADGSKSFSCEMELPIISDYPTAYTVKQIASENSGADGKPTTMHVYKQGEPIVVSKSIFEFAPSAWKSGVGASYTAETMPKYTEPTWTANPSVIPYDLTLDKTDTDETKYAEYQINFEAVVDGSVIKAGWGTSAGVKVVAK